MNNLPPEIIDNHILPLLDGVTLTALSSVSSEYRRLIIKKDELWKNICASTWPFSLPDINSFVSTFPGGYRSFFSDVFPSLHSSNNNNSQVHSIDHPPMCILHLIDMYLEGESHPRFSMSKSTVVESNSNADGYCAFPHLLHVYIPGNKELWMDYFQDNLRLNWIVINETQNCARSLFGPSSKPVSIKRTSNTIEVVCKNVMLGQCKDYTEMVKCYMKVKITCNLDSNYNGRNKGRLEVGMEDMNGKRVLARHANMIILNAILNGERKKF
ncbi:F-box protein At2g27310-like [Vicia villosa]|uniref:F-box protein At2g27310-like n=1 Tax=Vicia villosa TaxID=3911 RepID=UPI00273C4D94|nr:F-box protein At2g27310-like [Vicia villosa]